MRIVIIDSGINKEHNNIMVKGRHFFQENEFVISNDEIYESGMHGTLVYYTIDKIASCGDYYFLKVLNDDGRTNSKILLSALESTLNTECDIINISMSTANMLYYKDFNDICNELAKQNKIIVASASNNKENALPAMLESVIGVVGGKDLRGKVEYNNNCYECIVNDEPEFIFMGEKGVSLFAGTSKGAGIVCGIIAKMIKNKKMNFGKTQFIDYLKEQPLIYERLSEKKSSKFENYIIEHFGKDYPKFFYNNYKNNLNNLFKILEDIEKVFPDHRRVYLDDFKSEANINRLIRYGWFNEKREDK
jgi:hypothetical protein